MKRDMDLIRRIVLAARDSDGHLSNLEGVEQEQFCIHVQLLEEAGLVRASLNMGQKGIPISAIIWRLTWAGQDFADSIVDDTLWKKAKENVMKPFVSWTFDILIEYLKAEIRKHLPID